MVVERPADGVALITLNRPAARNAVNVELAQALVAAVGDAQDARCIVITGADPAFCAGLDLRNLGTDKLADLPPFINTVAISAVPTIAAVNGPAVTGGFEIALACDFIVASEQARFADTHLRVGVYPGPVLVDLPRRVGMAKAREMSMTGNFVDAETAAADRARQPRRTPRLAAHLRRRAGLGHRRAGSGDDRDDAPRLGRDRCDCRCTRRAGGTTRSPSNRASPASPTTRCARTCRASWRAPTNKAPADLADGAPRARPTSATTHAQLRSIPTTCCPDASLVVRSPSPIVHS